MIETLAAFMIKEVRHILRDRQTLTILLLMPLVQVVLFGYALRSDVRDVRLAIVDPSPDYASLALSQRFEAAKRFRIVAVAPSMERYGSPASRECPSTIPARDRSRTLMPRCASPKRERSPR